MRTARRFTLLCIALVSLGMGSGVAIAAPQGSPTKMDAPPPPGINDPGVPASKPTDAQDAINSADDANAADQDPLAPLPKPDTRPVRDRTERGDGTVAQRMAASEHTTRKQGDDTVEEYRQNGKVWMIHIVPAAGPDATFMDTTGTGRLTRDPRQGPVAPVYFSLYDWN